MFDLMLTEGAQWFTGAALVATLLFGVTVLLLFLGGDGAFKILSFQGIVGFSMGWGWGGLVAYRSLGWDWNLAALAGLVVGGIFLWMLWIGFKALHDLTGDGNVHAHETIGHEGTVTVAIPESGSGRVRLVIGRRQREFRAASHGHEIPSRRPVRVTAARDDGTLEVEPA
jgi:membrane protein implicated in regulation of membrane protease activity